MTASNSTTNNGVFSFVSDWKIVYYDTILDHNALNKRGNNILRYLSAEKNIQNCASKISREV